jgi:hypothetical protein
MRSCERKRARDIRSAKEENTGETKSYDASNPRAIVILRIWKGSLAKQGGHR